MAAGANDATRHLEPSELGTRSYWDDYYQNDIDNEDDEEHELDEPQELESWFDDVGAPAKILQFLTSDDFPLSSLKTSCTVMDLGTGNGSTLFTLRMEGGFTGPLVGVDYSSQSIRLAEKLKARYGSVLAAEKLPCGPMTFDVIDLITDDPSTAPWWPISGGGFDLVLDKGTFDAISLSSETAPDDSGVEKRLCELYPKKAAACVKPGGFLVLTTCNWTEDENIDWFTTGNMSGCFEVFNKIKYKSFQFGGRKGQGVATVCFRKLS